MLVPATLDRYLVKENLTNAKGDPPALMDHEEELFLPVGFTPGSEHVICSRGAISYHHGTYKYVRSVATKLSVA
jgi:hypothetical protein